MNIRRCVKMSITVQKNTSFLCKILRTFFDNKKNSLVFFKTLSQHTFSEKIFKILYSVRCWSKNRTFSLQIHSYRWPVQNCPVEQYREGHINHSPCQEFSRKILKISNWKGCIHSIWTGTYTYSTVYGPVPIQKFIRWWLSQHVYPLFFHQLTFI